MKRWALMNGNTVANVVEQDDMPQIGGTWMECGDASPGWVLEGDAFAPPVQHVLTWADTDLDPRYHWIDVGPFFDRFGPKALAITGSADVQVQGLVTLLLPRKYVDLKRADLPTMLGLLVAKNLITAAEMATALNPVTTDYERAIKGLPQPQ